MKDSDQNRYWHAAEAAIGLAILGLPWCLGGAPAWTTHVLLALAAIAAGLWTIGARANGRRWSGHVALLIPLCTAAAAAAQLVPLPPALLGILSPPAGELREFALVPLGFDAWRPITLDVPSTSRALARAIAIAGLLFVALQLGRVDDARRRLLVVIGLSGMSVAACAFGHLLASEDELFGLYRFFGTTPLVTPFGNTNHLAAFLTLTSTVALGLALTADTRDSKLGWGLAALAMGVAVFLTLSRGGIGAFVVTWAAVGSVVLARRVGGARSAAPWIIIGSTVLFALLLAFEQLVDRAESLDSLQKIQSTKVELWPSFSRAGLAAWPAGLGAGAFEVAFTRFQTSQLHETFTHPENVLLQWMTELGLPLTVALMLLSAWAGYTLWRGTKGRSLERIALLAVGGVVLHDVVDFSLELNGVVVLAVVCLGLAAAHSEGRRSVATARTLAIGALLLLIAGVASWKGSASHLGAERELAAAVKSARVEAEVKPLALSLIRRHPADYVLYANMASFTAQRGDPSDALAWVNRLLLLRPLDARAHVAAGRALLRLGRRNQALLEFRTSFELGDRTVLGLALSLAAKEGDFERLLIADRGFLTESRRLLIARGDKAAAAALLATALSAPPGEAVALEARTLEVGALADQGDVAGALAALETLPDRDQSLELALLRAKLLGKLSRSEEAVALLTIRLTADPANLDIAFALGDLFEAQRRGADARAVFARTRPFVFLPRARLELTLREAASWEADQRWGKALELVQSAARMDPSRPDLHYHLASIYERMSSYRLAAEELRRGRVLDSAEGAASRAAWLARLIEQAEGERALSPELQVPVIADGEDDEVR